MASLTHLAETSALSRLRHPSVSKALLPLAKQDALARCTYSDLEIGFSARNAREWDDLHRALRAFAAVDVLPQDYARACGVQRALAAAGLKGRKVPDLVVAAAAEREELTLLHYDHDFDLISDMTGQSCGWVVPRGSVD
ncbi:PIN domain-containing protein [Nocardia sp. BMG51109]|uniref:PIN domain-containing protein n=1 Tax=Nocardia sp. BMG51109 TaxID=1056816 RepID=UPI0012EC0DF1|nr:PIN domain-containing protein [Nocardia sp. BMG51109]